MRTFSKRPSRKSGQQRLTRVARWAAPAAMVCAAGVAHGQFRASIQGAVTDASGAVIPGATLTLTDQATNKVLTATSNAEGVYNFNALPPDHFKLVANAPGFTPRTVQDLTIIPEQANSVNLQLAPGGSAETVNVSGETIAAVDTETSNIGTTVTSNEIQHLPSFNRDVFTLSQLVPGAIADGGQAAGGGVRSNPGTQGPGGSGSGGQAPTENGPQVNANGGQYEDNGILIDGISTVSAVWGGTTIITPTEDSVDNVRILTNVYDAEYGRFSGATTLITSKGGSNQIHGSAFIAIHRPGLNAYNKVPHDSAGNFLGTGLRDNQRFNQYGGSIGFPIWKNKVFGFMAYESSPNNSTAQVLNWYETPSADASAPAGSIASKFTTFPGNGVNGTLVTNGITCTSVGLAEGKNCNTIAGQGLDIGSPLKTGLGKQDLTTDGTANTPGVGGGLDGVADIGYYLANNPTVSYYRQYNGRADADVTHKDHVAFAIYWVPQGFNEYEGAQRGYDTFNHTQINEALAGIWNHTFSPTWLNEARANAAGWRWNEIASNPQQPVGLPQANVLHFAPGTGVDSKGKLVSLQQFGSSLGSVLNQWTFGYKDVATKVAGTHTLKFGGEYNALHYLNDPIGRPTYTFYNLWDFLNDAPYKENGNFSTVTGLPGGTRSDERENLFGAFVQDAWKARPNLTFNYGLRYSYFGALYSKQDNVSTVRLGAGSAAYTGLTVPVLQNPWNPQKGNFGPQLGFNWSPGSFNNKLVVRGGYGLSFNEEEFAITANLGANPPAQGNYTFAYSSPSNPSPNGAAIVYGISSSPTSLAGFASNPNTITAYNSANLPVQGNGNIVIVGDGHGNLPTSYVEHYSMDTTYEFNRELVASLGYEGSVGRHLINHASPNAMAVAQGYALNPLVTSGDDWQNNGSSNNNAFLAELSHPMKHGVMVDAQFLWAKSLDTDGSGPYYEDPYYPQGPGYSYGLSDFNVGKSFKAYGLWQPVFFHGDHPWAEKIAGGWTLSGIFQLHTGFPYSPQYQISQSLYCSNCGYSYVRPQYLGGGNGDHSNAAFVNNTNYPGYATAVAAATTGTATVNGTANTSVSYHNALFNVPNFASAITAANGSGFPSPNLALPGRPGGDRNAFTGPGYRDVDASLTKGFGLPNTRLLGESAKLEIRADVFNLFNLLNLDPTRVTNNITATNFGEDRTALGGRTITFQGRFSF